MLARLSSNSARSRVQHSLRSFATVEKTPGGAIGTDGRHEIWRGDVDHDNEPKVRRQRLVSVLDVVAWRFHIFFVFSWNCILLCMFEILSSLNNAYICMASYS